MVEGDSNYMNCVLARPQHTEVLVEFYRQMDREQGLDLAASERGLRAALARHNALDDDRFMVFLVLEGQAAIGYSTVVVMPKLDDRQSVLFVDELYVLKGCRRKGAASLLLETIGQHAQRRGDWRVRLLTHEDNLPARHLYDRHDYDEWRPVFREYTVPKPREA